MEYDRRSMVNAVLYVVRGGGAWSLLPKDFAPWPTVYAYFRDGREKGLWELMHDELRERVRRKAGKNPRPLRP